MTANELTTLKKLQCNNAETRLEPKEILAEAMLADLRRADLASNFVCHEETDSEDWTGKLEDLLQTAAFESVSVRVSVRAQHRDDRLRLT